MQKNWAEVTVHIILISIKSIRPPDRLWNCADEDPATNCTIRQRLLSSCGKSWLNTQGYVAHFHQIQRKFSRFSHWRTGTAFCPSFGKSRCRCLSFLPRSLPAPRSLAPIPTFPNKKMARIHRRSSARFGTSFTHDERPFSTSLVWVKAGEGREISGAEDVCTAIGGKGGKGEGVAARRVGRGWKRVMAERKAAECHGGWMACLASEPWIVSLPLQYHSRRSLILSSLPVPLLHPPQNVHRGILLGQTRSQAWVPPCFWSTHDDGFCFMRRH